MSVATTAVALTLPAKEAGGMMRTFHLQRDEDETGVSGPGRVAEGCQFSDGRVAVRWIVGEHRSTVTWDSIDAVHAIHGHGGKTRVVWHEDRPGAWMPDYVPPGPRA